MCRRVTQGKQAARPGDDADVIDGITPVLGPRGGFPVSVGSSQAPNPAAVPASEMRVSEINGRAVAAAGILLGLPGDLKLGNVVPKVCASDFGERITKGRD